MNTTAQRLATLAQLYQQGQASEMMDRTLDKLLAHEADEARSQLAVLAADLATFEQQYGMSSAEFARRYEAGQTDDISYASFTLKMARQTPGAAKVLEPLL